MFVILCFIVVIAILLISYAILDYRKHMRLYSNYMNVALKACQSADINKRPEITEDTSKHGKQLCLFHVLFIHVTTCSVFNTSEVPTELDAIVVGSGIGKKKNKNKGRK
jgi:hypothetical protein